MPISNELVDDFIDNHPHAAARGIESTHVESAAVLDQRSPERVYPVLRQMSLAAAQSCFRQLSDSTQSEVLRLAEPTFVVGILATLPAEEQQRYIDTMPASDAERIRRIINLPEDSAGRYMSRLAGVFTSAMTVAQARDEMRAAQLQRARSIYVTDDDNHVLGRVDVQDLFLADSDQILSQLTHAAEGVMNYRANRRDLVQLFEQHRMDSVPVLDDDQRLLGVVRFASLFQAAGELASADVAKMVGASADEHALTPPLQTVYKRLPWLHINLLTAFAAAAVVGLYEDLIAQFTALAVLLPVVAGQSGNAGSQALAVTIRSLALREITGQQWFQVMRKEGAVGVINGFALAVTCGLGVYFWSGSLGLMLVIAVAMVLSMIAAGLSGALVPIILTRLGQDPATASSIILTTVTDIAGFFSFLGTATFLAFML